MTVPAAMRRISSLVLALGLAACALGGCGDPGEPEQDVVVFAVVTKPPEPPGGGCMAALLTGRLVADARWGIAVAAPDGSIVKVAWPNGYAGRRSLDGIELLDRDGRVVGRVGDPVELGGGFTPGDEMFLTCG